MFLAFKMLQGTNKKTEYICRTDGSAVDEPCIDNFGNSKKPTWKLKLWRACKIYIGPILLFLAYSFGGAGLFHYLESENELENISKSMHILAHSHYFMI